MTTRTCPECGTALAEDAPPLKRFCSDRCRYVHRDTHRSPERKAADAARHRERYAATAGRPVRPYRRKDTP